MMKARHCLQMKSWALKEDTRWAAIVVVEHTHTPGVVVVVVGD